MKSMIPLVQAIATVLLFFGCAERRVEVYHAASHECAKEEDQWVFENDTVMLRYSFWSSGGSMSFVIYNKATKPIFINWKNSALILNDQKMHYWSDAVKFSGSSSGVSATKTTSVTDFDWAWVTRSRSESAMATVTSGAMVKDEMITSLPPKSYIGFRRYQLLKDIVDVDSPNTDARLVSAPGKPGRTETIRMMRYNENSSPARYRNFLQLSFEEDMRTVFYIDNAFWLSEVEDMSNGVFLGDVIAIESDRTRVYEKAYRRRSSFYRRYTISR